MSRHPGPRRPARIVPTARPGGGHRLLVDLDRRVAREYRRAVAPLTPRIERSLGPGVMANRAVSGVVAVRVAPWRPAWATWERVLRAASRHRLLRADVASFYGSVGERALRSTFGDEAERLLEVLRPLWEEGVTGLPIGPEPSAIIANAVLGRVDEAIRGSGCQPLRWVDDWVLPVASGGQAGRLLVTIERALDDLGLQLNPAKTRVLAAGATWGSSDLPGSGSRVSARAMIRPP